MPNRLRASVVGLVALSSPSATWWGASASSVAGANVYGVAPADQAKYAPAEGPDGAPVFRCFSAAASDAGLEAATAPHTESRLELPYASVNDDYCDCEDGSDEPGTGACAGQHVTLFFCENVQSHPRYLYTSRVGDGVCDCCDGSDEQSPHTARQRTCPNTCEQEGRRMRQEHQRRQAERRKGIQQRERIIGKARQSMAAANRELQKLRDQRPSLEAAERDAAAALEVAQKALAAANRNSTSNTSSSTAELPAGEAANVTAETRSEGASQEAATSEPPPLNADGDGKAELPSVEPGGAAISEYTKWMEGAEEVVGSPTPPPPPPPASSESDEDDVPMVSCGGKRKAASCAECTDSRERACRGDCQWNRYKRACEDKEDLGVLGKVWRAVETVLSYVWPKAQSPEERAVSKASQAHEKARDSLSNAVRRIEELERQMDRATDDDKLAYTALEEKCLSKTVDEFNYEICFFKKAKQNSLTIGKWKDWKGIDVAEFTDGQPCPGGLRRSLRVLLKCGAKEEIETIEEPSRCAYEAVVIHPVACRPTPNASASTPQPRMPMDEL